MLPTQFPASFGPFELDGLLGRGGMAKVFDGHRVGAHGVRTRVAIKCLLTDDSTDGRAVQMFIDEARLNAHLRHPNLIAIHDFNEVDGVPYIAMEFVDGCDLEDLITFLNDSGEVIPPHVTVELLRQILTGLDYAHTALGGDNVELGLIHRDLKPANIFLSKQGTLKIGDFGIAKTRFSSMKTSTGMLKGTPAYLSPEQFKGIELTPAVDLFALGLILFEMLKGQRYFQQTTLASLAGAMFAFKPEIVVETLGDSPDIEHFGPILKRLLAPEPSQRYQSAMDVLADLAPLVAQFPMRLPLKKWLQPILPKISAKKQIKELETKNLQTLASGGNLPQHSFIADDGLINTNSTAAFGMESMARLMMDPSLSGEQNTPKSSTPVPLQAPQTIAPQQALSVPAEATPPETTQSGRQKWFILLALGIGSTLGLLLVTQLPSEAPDSAAADSALVPAAAPSPTVTPKPTPSPTAIPSTPTPSPEPAVATAQVETKPSPSKHPPKTNKKRVPLVIAARPNDVKASVDGGSPLTLPWSGKLSAGKHTLVFHCEGGPQMHKVSLIAGEQPRIIWSCPAKRPWQPSRR